MLVSISHSININNFSYTASKQALSNEDIPQEIFKFIPSKLSSLKQVSKNFCAAASYVERMELADSRQYVQRILSQLNPITFNKRRKRILENLHSIKNLILKVNSNKKIDYINKVIYKVLKLKSNDKEIPKSLRGCKDVVLIFLKQQKGYLLEHASPALRNDREVVLTAATQFVEDEDEDADGDSWRETGFSYASASLKDDKEFISEVMEINSRIAILVFPHISDRLKQDPDILVIAEEADAYADALDD